MSLWNAITSWMHRPFREPLDVGNWILLLILSSSIAFAWSRVLEKVLEE